MKFLFIFLGFVIGFVLGMWLSPKILRVANGNPLISLAICVVIAAAVWGLTHGAAPSDMKAGISVACISFVVCGFMVSDGSW